MAKIYWPGNRGQALERKLGVMAANPPRDPMKSRAHLARGRPRLSFRGGSSRASSCPTSIRSGTGRFIRSTVLPASRRARLEPACPDGAEPCCRPRRAPARYIAGDLNESNVLAATNTVVAFVDCDSMQVPDRARGRVIAAP